MSEDNADLTTVCRYFTNTTIKIPSIEKLPASSSIQASPTSTTIEASRP